MYKKIFLILVSLFLIPLTLANNTIEDSIVKVGVETKKQEPSNNVDTQNNDIVSTKNLEENSKEKEDQSNNSCSTVPFLNKVGLNIHANDNVIGDKNSKVVMIEYSSPTCVHCAYYHKNIFPIIKKKYIDTKKIAYISRQFITNKLDLDAAILPYCAKCEEKFLPIIETVLESQQKWLIPGGDYLTPLIIIGELLGVCKEEFEKGLKDDNLIGILIENNRAALSEPNFKLEPGTPAFFINGKKFLEKYSPEELSKALDAALEKSQTVSN